MLSSIGEMPTPGWLEVPVTLVGHPFASIGMGEQLRSHLASLRAIGLEPNVYDVFRHAQRNDSAHVDLVGGSETKRLGDGIRIFHINGDEVNNVLEVIARRGDDFGRGCNVIMPAWELPRYPETWRPALSLFDDIWAISKFVQDSIGAIGLSAELIGQAAEIKMGPFLGRRALGLRDDAFVLLSFLDLTSFATRKNPEAVLKLMGMALDDPEVKAGYHAVQCVLKVKNGPLGASEWVKRFEAEHPDVRFIAEPMSTHEIGSLIAACDCLVSLHRSEGFGRGPAEAMSLGRVALATNWSGNTDFMNESNSLPVPYDIVPLKEGDYPHQANQQWAEPDVKKAFSLLKPLILDRSIARRLGDRARASIRRSHGFRAIGHRSLRRLVELQERDSSRAYDKLAIQPVSLTA